MGKILKKYKVDDFENYEWKFPKPEKEPEFKEICDVEEGGETLKEFYTGENPIVRGTNKEVCPRAIVGLSTMFANQNITMTTKLWKRFYTEGKFPEGFQTK